MDPARIEELRRPEAYPGGTGEVEIVQTHLSVVCLVGDFAYKLAKAVRLPFADFSTLENRKHFSGEELRLNRRLCPDVYLEVVALRRSADGAVSFHGEGEIVDYAVKMRRLPADRMMDVLLAGDGVTEEQVREIAATMVRFHDGAERGEAVERLGDPATLRRFARENFSETEALAGSVFPGGLHAAMRAQTERDFERVLPLLEERLGAGRVVDGHGDLHARNICLTDPVTIYDCIEFEPAFRCGDVALEHAFLLMDLRFRGHPELAAAYRDEVIARSGDAGMAEVLPALMRYRAVVRAKVAAIESEEAEFSDRERSAARDRARRYLRLAASLAVEEESPCWILFSGLPGTGKTTVAEALAEAAGWRVHSSDRVRKELAGVAPENVLPGEFYSDEFSRRTYAEIERRAARETSRSRSDGDDSGRVVLLDANYRTRERRARVREKAAAAGARLVVVSLESDEGEILRRLRERREGKGAVSDADEAVYRKLREQFEAPEPGECDRCVRASGSGEADAAAEEVLAELLAPAPG